MSDPELTNGSTALANRGQVSRETTALATTETASTELAPTSSAAAVQQEIQAAVILSRQFPRDEDQALQRIVRACRRPRFAEGAEYSFPRGGKQVRGASVALAREAAKHFGNVRYGFQITRDDQDQRAIVAYAWDMETNARVEQGAEFRKLIQRKRNGATQWVKPDERDLRELTNKHAAIAMRNCLLQILPADFIDEAVDVARETCRDRAAQDPDGLRKRIIRGFDGLNVPVERIDAYLGHPIGESTPDELVDLRAKFKAIQGGEMTVAEAFGENGSSAPGKKLSVDDLGKEAATPQSSKPFTAAKAKNLTKAAKDAGFSDRAFETFLGETYGTDELVEIPATEETHILKWISDNAN